MILTRPLSREDTPDIIALPKNKQELLYAFPRAEFPLTDSHFYSVIDMRKDPTVATINNKLFGIVSLYDIKKDDECYIGNLLVHHEKRSHGIGRCLMEKISDIAIKNYSVKKLKLVCWAENNTGLLFYKKLGFSPLDIMESVIENRKIAVLVMNKYTG